ncbi:small multi-drug export protein [Alkalicoccobacillus porphyridii]|uniref:Small multi-drug export protein n=1 Tax=Alkalicoccobacillus porphyridii TaxID=2597270 RepID=A0A554A404_9BACI|nr:small multi-drug export protein [Alkalicoccobacillus porphyridii]TSB48422.1 small multi-drug export protein [Alkalicoccobacillus porphyridii]
MGYIIAYFVAFLLAATPFFEVVSVIPIGTIAGLDPFLTGFIALLGNALTVILVIIFVEQIQAWLDRRREKKGKPAKTKKNERAQRIFAKYGLPGLCLIGPTFGSHLTALIGMSLSGSRMRTTVWMMISLTLWTILMTILSFYGIEFLEIYTDNVMIERLRELIQN